MRVVVALSLIVAAVSTVGANPQKIVGGSVTTIDNYPSIVALLYTSDGSTYWQLCGGSIINNNAILTAAHCVVGAVGAVYRWRTRVGSTYANSGGVVHNTQSIIVHPNYNNFDLDYDVAIIRLAIGITLNNNARAGSYPGPNYNLLDNQVVWTAGWGRTTSTGQVSEQLRHVQIWTVNQNTCRLNYNDLAYTVTENMLCSGWLEAGGRDACVGDFGGPVYHNGVIVGVNSWNAGCGLARYPGISARVSRFITWIQANA